MRFESEHVCAVAHLDAFDKKAYTVTVSVAKLPEDSTTYSVTVSPPNAVPEVDPSNNTMSITQLVKIFANGFD